MFYIKIVKYLLHFIINIYGKNCISDEPLYHTLFGGKTGVCIRENKIIVYLLLIVCGYL